MGNEVKIDVLLAIEEANKRIEKLDGRVEKFAKQGETYFGRMSASWSSFVGNLGATAAVKALDMVADAGRKAFDVFVIQGVRAATEQEEAINSMNVALAQTGKLTRANSQAMDEYASQMQATTRFTDDQVLSTAALLQSIARLDTEGLKKAHRAAADLAVTFKMDLESAVRLVGRAAEGDVEQFGRLGIEIKKGNSNAETFANTMAVLSRFSGAAASEMNTFAGSVVRMQNSFGEIQETFGNFIVRNPLVIKMFNDMTKQLDELQHWIQVNHKEILYFVNNAIVGLVHALEGTFHGLNVVTKSFQFFYQAAVLARTGINGFMDVISANNTISQYFERIGNDAEKLGKVFSEQGIFGKAAAGVGEYKIELQNFMARHKDMTDTMVKNSNMAAKQTQDNFSMAFQQMGGVARDFGREYTKTLAVDIFRGKAGETGDIFSNMIDRMLSKIAESGITSAVEGIFSGGSEGGAIGGLANDILGLIPGGGLIGGVIGGIGDFFGGLFADGGIVPGNKFNGDKMVAKVNSGEMILTREDQQGLLQMVRGGGASKGGDVYVTVQGNVDSENRIRQIAESIKTLMNRSNFSFEVS